MTVPPFVYRYLLICKNKRLSNKQIIFILYFLFSIPVLLFAPMNAYLNIKHSDRIAESIPTSFDFCPGEKFLIQYENEFQQVGVSFCF
jgi:hypothetical protein